MRAFISKYTFQFMIYKTQKKVLKLFKHSQNTNPIIPNDTPRLVPKPASSCTEHMRQYPANFSVTNYLRANFSISHRGLILSHIILGTLMYQIQHYLSCHFENKFQVLSSIINSKFYFQTKLIFFQTFHYTTKFQYTWNYIYQEF